MDLEFDHNTILQQAVISRATIWGDSVDFLDNSGFIGSPDGWNSSSDNQLHIYEHLGSVDTSATNIQEFLQHSSIVLDTIPQNVTHHTTDESIDMQTFEIQGQVPSSVPDQLMLSLPTDMEQGFGTYRRESFARDFVARNRGEIVPVRISDPGLLNIPETAAPSFITPRSSFQSASAECSDTLNSQVTSNGQAIRNRDPKPRSRISSIPSDAGYSFSCFESHKFASQLSATSGRRGPLDKAAKSAMRAVTAAKACWRCKILRRRCNPDTPCDACPKSFHRSSRRSLWAEIGCKRGELAAHMLPLIHCSNLQSASNSIIENSHARDEAMESVANEYLRQILERRRREIDARDYPTWKPTELSEFLETLETEFLSDTLSLGSFAVLLEHPWSARLIPLEDCVQNIVWELGYCPSSQSVLRGKTMEELVMLLRSAALCQVRIVNSKEQLISRSLVCLTSSLELMRIQNSKYIDGFGHRTCEPSSCHIECINKLDLSLKQYLDELSRVFFLKENMRNIKSWWLSGFYSLCIQSVVRQALIKIETYNAPAGWGTREVAPKQFLQLAVRLFVTSSPVPDLLVSDLPQSYPSGELPEEMVWDMHCKVAQVAVKQDNWIENGMKNSGDYLKRIFEDDGQTLILGNVKAIEATENQFLGVEATDNDPIKSHSSAPARLNSTGSLMQRWLLE
ncbi:hypothetical protein N431DRAFT_476935 [Stipitochalara longipes BDJ]|nr:hypothetical protein N431DRAFT_476935 [Stipitochalara longipes BDJ]